MKRSKSGDGTDDMRTRFKISTTVTLCENTATSDICSTALYNIKTIMLIITRMIDKIIKETGYITLHRNVLKSHLIKAQMFTWISFLTYYYVRAKILHFALKSISCVFLYATFYQHAHLPTQHTDCLICLHYALPRLFGEYLMMCVAGESKNEMKSISITISMPEPTLLFRHTYR